MPLRRFTAAELVLTQRLHLERPLLAMVLLSAAGFALAEGNFFYVGLIAWGVMVNALALYRRCEIYLPRFFVNAGVLAASGFFLFDLLTTPNFFHALGHYLILIQLCKLFEQKRNRDYVQIMALSVVLVLNGALVTTGMWFGLLLLLFVPVACHVGMVLTLKISLDRQASARLAVELQPADPRRLAWNVSGEFPTGRLWRRAFGAALTCAVAAVVVFLLMPRGIPGAVFELPRIRGRAIGLSGFPETFRLTDLGRITLDRRVVMHARLESDGTDLGPGGFSGYLRGRTYDSYRGGEWFARPGRLPWSGGLAPAGAAPPRDGRTIVQHVTLDPSLLPMTFAIAPVCRVELPAGTTFSGLYPRMCVQTARGDCPLEYTAWSFARPFTPRQRKYLAGLRERARSDLRSRAARARRLVAVGADGSTRRGPRLADTIAPPVAELARQWCADLLAERGELGGANSPRPDEMNLRIARRIARRLSGGYHYSLDLSQADPDRDPVEDFLFHTRRGHCQFFASAMVLMCRSLGLKARLASGFLATEYSAAAGTYVVRAADAHAWCEVFTPASDWMVIDPTPAGARERGAGRLGRLADLWGSLGFFWRTHVIGYGEADRQGLFGRFLQNFRAVTWGTVRFLRRTGRAAWELLSRRRSGWPLLLSAMPAFALGLAAVTSAVLLVAVVRRRRRLVRVPVHSSLPEFYHRLLRLLWRRGRRQRPDQTPREFLLELAAETDLPAGELGELAELLYRLRWGGVAPSGAALRRGERTAERVAGRIRNA